MSTVATTIEVNVPVRTAYNQWTQFEIFPNSWKEGKKSSNWMTAVVIGRLRLGGGKNNGMLKSRNKFLTSALPGRVSAEP